VRRNIQVGGLIRDIMEYFDWPQEDVRSHRTRNARSSIHPTGNVLIKVTSPVSGRTLITHDTFTYHDVEYPATLSIIDSRRKPLLADSEEALDEAQVILRDVATEEIQSSGEYEFGLTDEVKLLSEQEEIVV
jgi:hypothetical protein